MKHILSNYGHRYLTYLDASGALAALLREREDVRVLARVFALAALPEGASPELPALAARGMVQLVDDDVDAARRYAQNPLEHLRRVVFEYTTLCNLDCLHCRNSSIEARGEAHPEGLRRVVDAVLPLGVDRFDFIGGEVTLYGKGWLDLAAHIRAAGGRHVSVITSGWFLGERDFRAAGERYADDRAYLAALRARGVTHVVFSLDGPEEVHDRGRGVPGLYRRILAGIEEVRAAGLTPRVSLVIGLGGGAPWVAEIARLLYGPELRGDRAASRLVADDANYVSNFIDVGAGVELRRSPMARRAFTDEELRCKNFFRPSPTLRIKAGGEISLCPLVQGGDGYGNVHERDVVELLNHLQDALVYKLHAERRIGEVRRFLDEDVFHGALAHPCSARVALNMIARTMAERGIRPDDGDALHAVNVEVATRMGVIPAKIARRANGQARP